MQPKITPAFSGFTLFLICCLSVIISKANPGDTLTNSQVYNFNVGDTFDFYVNSSNADYETYDSYYERRILISKTYSTNLDTLFLKYYSTLSGTRTDIVIHPDGFAVFQDSAMSPVCEGQYFFNDTNFFNRRSDSVEFVCFESGEICRYTQNLGRTFYNSSAIAYNSNGCICYTETLIYYGNDSIRIGTPYYIAGESGRIHYIPLPEECAVWTESISGYHLNTDTFPPTETYATIIEQFKTGNKIYYHNKTFVELYLSEQNGINNTFKPDSLIGYFYNDSINESAYFVTDTNYSNIYLIYTCAILAGDGCSNGVYGIDSILIGGGYRTRWQCNGQNPQYRCGDDIIAGIGYLSGLIPNGTINDAGLITSTPSNGWMPACSYLSCFSICNQTLYPTDTSASCPILNNIAEVNDAGLFSIYPNPTSDYCHLKLNAQVRCSAAISDITGRDILPLFNNQYVSDFGFSTWPLAPGVYLIRLTDESGRESIAKLIKE